VRSDCIRRRRRPAGNSYSSRVMSPRISAIAEYKGGGVGGESKGRRRRRTGRGSVEKGADREWDVGVK
jgi:hypothetical protein